MKKITFLFLMLLASVSFSQTSNFCETTVTHFNIEAETASAIKLTITNVDAVSMYVEIESANDDAVDFFLVNNGSGATISDADESVTGKIRRTLTWETAPVDVSIELLWSKESTGGNWMLNTFIVPFAANCVQTPIEEDATLSDLQVDGTTIDGFSAGIFEYTYGVLAEATVPVVTATATNDGSATVLITPAASIPDTTIVKVTAQDGVTINNYKIAFVVTTPTASAAVPPAREAADVISIFSDAYTDVAETDFNPNWGQSTVVTTEDIAGNSTLKYANLNYQGTVLGSTTDASLMEYMHIDMWTYDATSVQVFPISVSTGESSVELSVTAGSWKSYDIALSEFTSQGLSMADLKELKFAGTTGSTIYLDNIYFYKVPLAPGADATLSDIKVDDISIEGFSPAIFTYTVDLVGGTTLVPTITVVENDVDASSVITPAATIADTTIIEVTAQDGVTKLSYKVAFDVSSPGDGAPIPPAREAVDVISIFSDAYTDVAGTDFNPNWGQSTVVSIDTISSNATLKYANLNYQGTSFGSTQDVSLMEYLHLDVWTNDAAALQIFPISASTGEKSVDLDITVGSWKSYDIALSEFTSQGLSMADIFQLKVVGTNGSTVFIDNIYFHKAPDPEGTDANLSDLKVDDTTIDGFSVNILNYKVALVEGTTIVPVVSVTTNDENATVVITQAAAIPDTAMVKVTAQDGTTTKTYTVAFAISIPANAAATPPARNASDVISIFSDAYTNVEGTDFNPNWGQSTVVSIDSILSNTTLKYANLNYQGTQLGSTQDASEMQHLHLDVWTNDATSLQIYPISLATGEKSVDLEITTGSWKSYDIALSEFTSQGLSMDDIHQLKIVGSNGSMVYFDNIYFYRVLSDDATLSDLQVDSASVTNFDPATTEYIVELDYGTTDVPVVTATVADSTASMVISQAITLPDTASVEIIAEDGVATKLYQVIFTIAAPSTDASLSDLLMDDLTVIGFDSDTLDYHMILPFGTVDVPNIAAITSDENATLVITQAADLSSAATVLVTAEDGVTELTYTVSFTVAEFVSSDATLRSISVNGESVVDFASDVLAYSVELPYGTAMVPEVTAITTNSAASYVVNNATDLLDTTSIVVTAQDDTTIVTYKVSFTIAEPRTDATLVDLQVDGATIFGFDPEVLDYSVYLPYGTTDLPIVSAFANDTAANYEITQPTAFLDTALIEVMAQDGVTILTYSIAFSPTYAVTFTVTDENEVFVSDAEIIFLLQTLTTDMSGMAEFTSVSPTTNTVYTVSKDGYIDFEGIISVVDEDVAVSVMLELIKYSVQFNVVDADENALVGASVDFQDQTVITDENGVALFESIAPVADAAYTVSKDGYYNIEGTVSVVDADVEVGLALQLEVYNVTFSVVDADENAIEGAVVAFQDQEITTGADGLTIFEEIAPTVDAAYSVSKDGYELSSGMLSVIDADVILSVELIINSLTENQSLVSNIYPNPTNGAIYVQLANGIENATVELYDASGKTVLIETMDEMQTQLNLSGYEKGVYFIKVTSNSQQYLGRVVVN